MGKIKNKIISKLKKTKTYSKLMTSIKNKCHLKILKKKLQKIKKSKSTNNKSHLFNHLNIDKIILNLKKIY